MLPRAPISCTPIHGESHSCGCWIISIIISVYIIAHSSLEQLKPTLLVAWRPLLNPNWIDDVFAFIGSLVPMFLGVFRVAQLEKSVEYEMLRVNQLLMTNKSE